MININDNYALVKYDSTIGSKCNIRIGSKLASIVETGEKDFLANKSKRYNKLLSTGEKNYYKISYSVVKINQSIKNQWELK